MKRSTIEFGVGVFMLVGLACFAYLAVQLGDIGLGPKNVYTVQARFGSVSGLKTGASIEMSGVRIGKVTGIELDKEALEAVVWLQIENGVPLQEDVIASIRTQGIIGDRFVKITPGGAPDLLADGDLIIETEPAISLEELVSKYIFESDNK